ncbi:MAG: hypothetical protein ACK4FV_04245 [Candidatus Nitrosocaldus sp.]
MNIIYMMVTQWDANAALGIAALLPSVLMGSISEGVTYLPYLYITNRCNSNGTIPPYMERGDRDVYSIYIR